MLSPVGCGHVAGYLCWICGECRVCGVASVWCCVSDAHLDLGLRVSPTSGRISLLVVTYALFRPLQLLQTVSTRIPCPTTLPFAGRASKQGVIIIRSEKTSKESGVSTFSQVVSNETHRSWRPPLAKVVISRSWRITARDWRITAQYAQST